MSGEREPQADTFSFEGDALSMDFVNTVDWRLSTSHGPIERLRGYSNVLAWARQSGTLDAGTADALGVLAAADPAGARAATERAKTLREAMFGAFHAAAAGDLMPAAALRVIGAYAADATSAAALVADPTGVHWRWPAAPAVAVPGATPPMLDRPIWPVAKQAADLLTAPRELARVGLCAGDGCGWLFFDRTGRRRWCSMRSCGNRAKAASYYQRHKGAPHTSTN